MTEYSCQWCAKAGMDWGDYAEHAFREHGVVIVPEEPNTPPV